MITDARIHALHTLEEIRLQSLAWFPSFGQFVEAKRRDCKAKSIDGPCAL
jgi:hypothetical protein